MDPNTITVSDDVGFGSTGATAVIAMAPTATNNRFYGVLNTDVLVRWFWTGAGFDQEDLNLDLDGIQGLDISTSAPGPDTSRSIAKWNGSVALTVSILT